MFEKLTKEASDAHRAVFDSVKPRLRAEWEAHTGQKWPVYEVEVEQEGITKIVQKNYDAHNYK